MSLTRTALLLLAALGFCAIFLAVLLAQKNQQPPGTLAPATAPASIEGKLDISEIDDIRVGGRKILLCGVAFTRPAAMRTMISEAARRDFQGKAVSCKTIGAGTPCDGKVAASFGGSIVAQCLTANGVDLAAEFSRLGFLCDQPAQSGGYYSRCSQP